MRELPILVLVSSLVAAFALARARGDHNKHKPTGLKSNIIIHLYSLGATRPGLNPAADPGGHRNKHVSKCAILILSDVRYIIERNCALHTTIQHVGA